MPYAQQMTGRRLLVSLVAVLALVSVGGATAGGPFQRIVGVGANGAWRAISLQRSGVRSDAALSGAAVPVPRGGYVRIYPSIGGLPGVPGRYYAAAHVLCLYWHEPVSNCSRLGDAGIRLLSPLARLPLRLLAPTVPVAVRYRSHLLRYADGNIFAALELALERPALVRSSVPRDAIRLAVTWHGPEAARMPLDLALTPSGVYTGNRLFVLPRGPWCYLAANLPDPSALQIEAANRVCR